MTEAFVPLKKKPIWVLHRNKIPIRATSGTNASKTNPNDWAIYDYCIQQMDVLRDYDGIDVSGLGIVFTDGFVGVDLDHVISDGKITPEAEEIIADFDSYTEYSPSGTGVHIYMYIDPAYRMFAGIPDRENIQGQKFPLDDQLYAENNDAKIEFYTGNHYFTVTENPLPGYDKPIAKDRTELFKKYFQRYLSKQEAGKAKKKKEKGVTAKAPSVAGNPSDELAILPLSNDDKAVLEELICSKDGDSILELFRGDMSRYDNDHSRADLALCNYLAPATNGDADQIDRLFRVSGLMRNKWDEARGDSTWGANTIALALENFTPSTDIPTQAAYIANTESGFFATIEKRKAQGISTGFHALDKAWRLYPGLFLLGGMPGIGKSSLALQIAVNVAKSGHKTLYYSLEQSVACLSAKAITCFHSTKPNISAWTEYYNGEKTFNPKLLESYLASVGDNLCIVYASTPQTASLQNMVNKLTKGATPRGVPPIVIVDYCQLLQSNKVAFSERNAVEAALDELIDIQRRKNLTMLAICSLSRAGYSDPSKRPTMAALKETGKLEYSADQIFILWGQGKLTLSNLKNKEGQGNWDIGMTYDGEHSCFKTAKSIQEPKK